VNIWAQRRLTQGWFWPTQDRLALRESTDLPSSHHWKPTGAPHGGVQAVTDRTWREHLIPASEKWTSGVRGEDARDREHQQRKIVDNATLAKRTFMEMEEDQISNA
jgi:hypothetical protein